MHQSPQSQYQGRRLPRPHEEVTDQGLGFDLATLISRRRLLRVMGAGAAVLGIAACAEEPAGAPAATGGAPAAGVTSSVAAASAEIPEETQGPFPGDGSNGPDVLERSGIVRGDIRTNLGNPAIVAAGVPLTLQLSISDLADGGRPLAGAAVYIWQCDQAGRYSMYSDGVAQQTFLRGVQIVDSTGAVRFTTVFPGCYPGRWPHIHFEVYPDRDSITDHTTVIATSQLAFPKDVSEAAYREPGYESSVSNLADISLATDMVFRDDRAARQTARMGGNATGGYHATLAVAVRTRT
ncbi:protocatechuate 3,4-dioxygenase beta subunit [Actinoplanes tereljensis]|uniref:3,4-dioxygenase subunit beta n=1 Tax=Paractinoplanes tereljensis TaxID=571912 RepID=A0A919NTJ4_9ACTN|nr:3,4-dioxygenase subunit beta [Actinoplanes tereljensis]GIF23277.1 3,4-dioxygenase subunit beta [Actinoplanes tereljensis]